MSNLLQAWNQKKMPNNPKNTRRCCVCRQHADKSELVRLVKTEEGIVIDKAGKIQGRGVYVHRHQSCIDACIKKQSLNAAFKGSVNKEVYDELAKQI